jgi:DNA invertase Pin-like site-specific DNA recombinase
MRPGGSGRVWILLRVSGRGQATEGTGLEGQEQACRRYLAGIGYTGEPTVRTDVESATGREERAGVREIIRAAQPGDLIVVAAVSRWSRHLVWGLRTIREMVERGVRFYAVYEALDPATPEGRRMLGLMLWVAENEAETIKARTVGRAEELRRQGLWAFGTVPWGYVRGDRAEHRQLLLAPDLEEGPHVLELHERCARGESARQLVAFTAPFPGAPHDASSIHRILRSRIYLGEVRIGGTRNRWDHGRPRDAEWVNGQHPPLVPLDLWERCQAALDKRRTEPVRIHRGETAEGLLLVSLLRCGICGYGCEVGRVKNRWGSVYRYYVCFARRRPYRGYSCTGPYARAQPLDEAAEEAVLARLGELRELLASRPERQGDGSKAPPDFAAMRHRVEQRLARAVSAFTDGTLTREELAAQRARLDGELLALRRREEAAAREARAADPVARRDLRRALGDLRKTWRKATAEERRRVVALLAAKVEVDADGALRWTWRTVEDLVQE